MKSRKRRVTTWRSPPPVAEPPITQQLRSQEMELIKLDAAKLEEALVSGEFKLLSWSLCASLGLMHWKKGKEERQRKVK